MIVSGDGDRMNFSRVFIRKISSTFSGSHTLRAFRTEKNYKRLLSSDNEPWKKYEKRTASDLLFSKESLLLFTCGLGALVCFGYYKKQSLRKIKEDKKKKYDELQKKNLLNLGFFRAVDTDGRNVTDHAFRGKWLLVYFGFTHCPDICPEVLEKMSEMVTALKDTITILPVFVTIDPHRDNPASIKSYLSEYHPDFIGLTGSQKQLAHLFSKFNVYVKQHEQDTEGDYILDHTVVTYLVDPTGTILEHFTRSQEDDEQMAIINKHVAAFKS